MEMLDRWHYKQLSAPIPYGCDTTYSRGMAWLDGLPVVEDWGCGACYASKFLKRSKYVGVDGSASPWTTVVADLRFYTSTPDGLFMRHVLEHNHDWDRVLASAMRSFRSRFVLVIFTPFGPVTRAIPTAVNGNAVPDISFAKSDLTNRFGSCAWRDETLATQTQYGTETIFYVERPTA